MKIGNDKGNPGALVRWGNSLDNGIWLRGWAKRKLWLKWNFSRVSRGYLSFGIIVLSWGN